MSLRQPHEAALLFSEEVAFLRASLSACSSVLDWIGRNGGDQGRALLAEACRSVAGRNTPGHLEYDLNLAIDYLDFAPAARRKP
jgi:hypothetical protein